MKDIDEMIKEHKEQARIANKKAVEDQNSEFNIAFRMAISEGYIEESYKEAYMFMGSDDLHYQFKHRRNKGYLLVPKRVRR